MANEYKTVISDQKKEANKLMTDEQITACNVAIHTASIAAGAAGVIPVPVADAVPISGAQVTMAIALGKVFDQKLEDSAAKALIGTAASTFVGRTLVKLIPVAGWLASAAIAAGVTEAIGWTLAVDFAKQYNAEHSNDKKIIESESVEEQVEEEQTQEEQIENEPGAENSDVDNGTNEDDQSVTRDFEEEWSKEE